MNIQNCHFSKCYHVRCHINWVQDFHSMLYLNSLFLLVKCLKKYRSFILLNSQVYQASKSVMMNQRVHHFHDLGRFMISTTSKSVSWMTADYLEWTIYVKTKSCVCIYMKKTSTKLYRPSNPLLSK